MKDFTLLRNLEADFTVLELRIEAKEISKNPDCLLMFIDEIDMLSLSNSLIGEEVDATNSPAGSVGLTLSGLTASTVMSPDVFDTDSFLLRLNIVGLVLNLNESLIFNLFIDFQLTSSDLSGDKLLLSIALI